MAKTMKAAKRGKAPFNKDKRRRHHHFLVTVYYADGEKFGRVYTDKEKATRFADRQRRSPVVKSVRVSGLSGLSIVVVRNLAKVQVSVRFR